MDLSPQDKRLLDLLQKEFPLVPQPFAVLGERVGLAESEVVAKVGRWQEAGVLRRLGPVFDSKKIGYKSLLAAMACPAQRLKEVSEIINAYPGVTHNYLREAGDDWDLRYNLWFTMTGATDQEVQANLAEIVVQTGISDLLPMPAHTLYKIKVQFDLEGESGSRREAPGKHKKQSKAGETLVPLTSEDWRLIEAYQGELKAEIEPFASIAQVLGLEVGELLIRTRILLDKGVIRRFGATLKHYSVGYGANAMGVWAVPAAKEDEAVEIMATFKAVSHCYARSTYPQWPYNLYTMIHGSSRQDCAEIAGEISAVTGITDYHLLFTVQELKKERMIYSAPRRNS